MRAASQLLMVIVFLTGGLVTAYQHHAGAKPVARAADRVPIQPPAAETLAKKCSFDSDCAYGKCKSGLCGGCSFDSDCKGWGKCKDGTCGACNFSSECKGFGDCSSGRCTKSPY